MRASLFLTGLLAMCLWFPAHTFANLGANQKAGVNVSFTQNFASEFLVSVTLGQQRFRFATVIPEFESATEGLSKQRALSGWKGDYLFVRHQCGQIAEWRCVVDQIFTRVGETLIHLGAVESAACEEVGCRFDAGSGLFMDLFDVYQINPVTGATDSPPLTIAKRIRGQTFVADLEETWKLNLPAYNQSLACLQQIADSGFGQPCAQNQTAWSALVFSAKLSHYTGRIAERDALFANQAVSYCNKSADSKCNWRVAGVKDYYQRFPAGAMPTFTPSRVSQTSAIAVEKNPKLPEAMPPGQPIKLKM